MTKNKVYLKPVYDRSTRLCTRSKNLGPLSNVVDRLLRTVVATEGLHRGDLFLRICQRLFGPVSAPQTAATFCCSLGIMAFGLGANQQV